MYLIQLMSFVHERPYTGDTTYEPDILGELTPVLIKQWMYGSDELNMTSGMYCMYESSIQCCSTMMPQTRSLLTLFASLPYFTDRFLGMMSYHDITFDLTQLTSLLTSSLILKLPLTRLTHACHPTQACIPTCILIPARQACNDACTLLVQSVQGYMHTPTSMLTSANCSHSRNLINSIFVVCTVVSLSDHLHTIAVALSVLSL